MQPQEGSAEEAGQGQQRPATPPQEGRVEEGKAEEPEAAQPVDVGREANSPRTFPSCLV